MKKITALVISVIMICSCTVSCSGPEEVNLHTYEATVGDRAFKAVYLADVSRDGETTALSESELEAVDTALSDAVKDKLWFFSEENSEGIYELNKEVDAILDCNEDVIEFVEYAYSLTETADGKYQPVMGAATSLYSDGSQVTAELLSEAMTHVGNELIVVDGANVRKSDRKAKFDFDSIVEGYVLADTMAVLSSKNINYAILSCGNTVATYGSLEKEETVDMAVYLSNDSKMHSGILSFNDTVVTTCNSHSLVLDVATGEKVQSEHDTVIVLCSDGVLSNVIAPIIYGMSTDDIMKLYNKKQLNFEAVIIDANGDFVTTSEAVVYEKNVSE